MLTKREEIERWLTETPVLERFQDSKQQEAFIQLLGNEGFRGFLGLLLGSRQAFYSQLSMIPLDGVANAARASVIQGQIKGIDLVRDTVLEQSLPITEGA